MTELERAAVSLARKSSVMHAHPEHATARHKAFSWYIGHPPSPGVAARYFALRADRDPANGELYAEALKIFLATCWNLRPAR